PMPQTSDRGGSAAVGKDKNGNGGADIRFVFAHLGGADPGTAGFVLMADEKLTCFSIPIVRDGLGEERSTSRAHRGSDALASQFAGMLQRPEIIQQRAFAIRIS